MEFRTEIRLHPSKYNITHQQKLVTIGSCFADVLAGDLAQLKFSVCANPFGIIYNPISIFNLLRSQITFDVNRFVEREQYWFSYDVHSELSAPSVEALSSKLKDIHLSLHRGLAEASYLVITFGTAWVYQLVNGGIVANCHKQPAQKFQKKLLSTASIVEAFNDFYIELKQQYQELNIILTLSPVRHIKDTIELNLVSKSTLRLVCNELVNRYSDVIYFPAYEIMMDDLRDYRFYTADLIHPNDMAERYILDKFYEMFFSNATMQLNKQIAEIKTGMAHRPFNPSSQAHRNFLESLLAKVKLLEQQLPMSFERIELEQRLSNL